MSPADKPGRVAAEQQRILAEYRRREREVDHDGLYALWNSSALHNRAGRTRRAARLLARCGVFPKRGDACLEIGFGSLGWLAELLAWGLAESDLHGIELDSERAAVAREAFPSADLRVGDASRLALGGRAPSASSSLRRRSAPFSIPSCAVWSPPKRPASSPPEGRCSGTTCESTTLETPTSAESAGGSSPSCSRASRDR